MSKKIKIELELDAKSIATIEEAAEADIKSLLENEINNHVVSFCELMGYDNW